MNERLKDGGVGGDGIWEMGAAGGGGDKEGGREGKMGGEEDREG